MLVCCYLTTSKQLRVSLEHALLRRHMVLHHHPRARQPQQPGDKWYLLFAALLCCKWNFVNRLKACASLRTAFLRLLENRKVFSWRRCYWLGKWSWSVYGTSTRALVWKAECRALRVGCKQDCAIWGRGYLSLAWSVMGQQREKQTDHTFQQVNRLTAYLCIVPSPKTFVSLQGNGFDSHFFKTKYFLNTFSRTQPCKYLLTAAEFMKTIMMMMDIRALQIWSNKASDSISSILWSL